MFLEGLEDPGRQVGAAGSTPTPAGVGLWHSDTHLSLGQWICFSAL